MQLTCRCQATAQQSITSIAVAWYVSLQAGADVYQGGLGTGGGGFKGGAGGGVSNIRVEGGGGGGGGWGGGCKGEQGRV